MNKPWPEWKPKALGPILGDCQSGGAIMDRAHYEQARELRMAVQQILNRKTFWPEDFDTLRKILEQP